MHNAHGVAVVESLENLIDIVFAIRWGNYLQKFFVFDCFDMFENEAIYFSLPASAYIYLTISSNLMTFSRPFKAIRILISRLIFLNLTKIQKILTRLQHLYYTFLGVPKIGARKHLWVFTPPNFLFTDVIRTLFPHQILVIFIIVVGSPSLLGLLSKCFWSFNNKLIFGIAKHCLQVCLYYYGLELKYQIWLASRDNIFIDIKNHSKSFSYIL